MDFLKIRKKAKERAGARESPSGPEPAGAAPGPPEPAGPPADPVVTDADVLEGALAARLQGLPPAADERFTTWRPGSGAPPDVQAPPPPAPEPSQDDFTVVTVAPGPPVPPPPELAAARPPAAARDPLGEFFYRPDEEGPEVPEIGAPAAASAEREVGPLVREEYLTFLLGGEAYAVPIEQVREVMRAPPITEVPHAPPHVLGVVTVRGEVVAVFDPRRRLGLPWAAPAEGAGRVVIVDAGEGPCGLVVDVVSSVVRLPPGSVEPCPQALGGPGVECFAGIGRDGDRLFTVLDLGAFLRRPQGAARRAEEDRHAGR